MAKRMKIITNSGAESETYAVNEGCKRLAYVTQFMEESTMMPIYPVPVYVDCTAAIHWCINPVVNAANGHMKAKYFYARQCYFEGIVKILKIDSSEEQADVMVTYKSESNFHHLVSALKNTSYDSKSSDEEGSKSDTNPRLRKVLLAISRRGRLTLLTKSNVSN